MSHLDASMINRAAPPGSMRYFSLLYAPESRRDALMALYVIDAEIRESAQSANHDVAHTRLRWWRDEIDRLVNGNPQHPATRTLHEQQPGSPPRHFARLHELLAAADMDLARMTYLTMRELGAYCVRSGGVIAELLAEQLMAPAPVDDTVRAAARGIGSGVRQAEILRDLRQDATDGRLYLPLEDMDRSGVSLEDARQREVGAPLRELLARYREHVREGLLESERALPSETRDRMRPLLVLSALYRGLLDRIAQRNYEVGTERIELGPFAKPWIAWRAARRA